MPSFAPGTAVAQKRSHQPRTLTTKRMKRTASILLLSPQPTQNLRENFQPAWTSKWAPPPSKAKKSTWGPLMVKIDTLHNLDTRPARPCLQPTLVSLLLQQQRVGRHAVASRGTASRATRSRESRQWHRANILVQRFHTEQIKEQNSRVA